MLGGIAGPSEPGAACDSLQHMNAYDSLNIFEHEAFEAFEALVW